MSKIHVLNQEFHYASTALIIIHVFPKKNIQIITVINMPLGPDVLAYAFSRLIFCAVLDPCNSCEKISYLKGHIKITKHSNNNNKIFTPDILAYSFLINAIHVRKLAV